MFSASAAYAHAVSAQYGYQSHGGMGVNDPRSGMYQAQQGLQAGAMGGMLAKAPGMAMGGLGMMSMFGMGPRALDPFTMTMHMGAQGFARQGLAGAIGMGAATFGTYAGLGAMGNWATGHMVGGAQNRGMLNSQMGQMFPGMNAQGLGMMSQQVESQARMGMGNLREITSVMQQGVSSGAIDSSTLSRFSQSFNKLMSNVRQVATVMNTSLQQAQSAMQAVSGMGISSDQAAGFLGTMKGIGQATHISPQQMMGVAQAGANFGQAAGIDMGQAATGAMVSAGVYGYTERNKLIKGITGAAQGRYTQAATRFLGSRRGQTVLGAMMTSGGEFDMDAARQIASGTMNWKDIKSAYAANITGASQRDMLRARGGELAGQFISEFGPQSISGALGSLRDQSSNPESLARSLTGLNRNDLRAMDMLASNTGQLRSKMLAEARAGFQEGQGRMGIGDVMSKAMDTLTKPIREKFQKLGANLTQYTQEALEDVTNQFVRGGNIGGSPQGMHQAAMDITRFHATGNTEALRDMQMRGDYIGGFSGASTQWGGQGAARGWAGQFARDFTPMGMQIGNLSAGTQFGELPMGGLGLSQFQPGQSAFAFGSAARIFPGGRNALGAGGALMSNIGQRITGGGPHGYTGLFGGRGSGPLGMGGFGPISGTGRLAGGSLRVGGFMSRGLGAVLGGLGTPLMAYDMITNSGPEAMRQFGMAGISDGAITGNNARLLESLTQSGILPEDSIQRMNVGAQQSGGLDAAGAATLGLTPIGGTFQHGEGGMGGSQGFLTKGGRSATEKLLSKMGGDHSTMISRLGGDAKVKAVISRLAAEHKDNKSDYELMNAFIKETGATKEEAYILLGTHNNGADGGAFKNELKQKFDLTQKYSGDPQGARQHSVDVIKRRVGRSLAWQLGNKDMSKKERKELAKQLLGEKSEASGLLEDFAGANNMTMYEARKKLTRVQDDGVLLAGADKGGSGLTDSDSHRFTDMKQTKIAALTQTAMESMGPQFGSIISDARKRLHTGENRNEVISSVMAQMPGLHQQSRDIGKLGKGGVSPKDVVGAWLDDTAGSFGGKTAISQGISITAEHDVTRYENVKNEIQRIRRGHRDESPTAQQGLRISAMRGGYANLNQFRDIHEKFKKGLGTVSEDGKTVTTEDFETGAMQDFARSLMGDNRELATNMQGGRLGKLTTSLAKGDSAVERRMTHVAASVDYYTKQWENSDKSPHKFLAKITHDPSFNKLTKREQAYLAGTDKTGLTTRLEGMLQDSARDMLVASGRKPTNSEVEQLADKLVKGSETSGGDGYDFKDLVTDLSSTTTPIRPGTNRGGSGAGAHESVQNVVSALDGLASKLNSFSVPGQNMSYSR